MKILHYVPGLPPVRGGGLIKYALDLAQAQNNNNQVFLLIPGSISIRRKKRYKVRVRKSGYWKGISLFKIKNPLPIPMANGILDIEEFTLPCAEGSYRKFLAELQPDIIHIHSLMGIHRQFMLEAGDLGIPVIYTTHDYFGLCPAVHLFYKGKTCTRPWVNCEECSRNAFPEKRLLLEQSAPYRMYRKNDRMIRLLQTRTLKSLFKGIRSTMPDEIKQAPMPENTVNVTGGSHLQACNRPQDYKKLQEYYHEMFRNVTCFHFNSDISRQVYEQHLGPLPGQVIGISNRSVKDRRKIHESSGKLKIGFVGGDIVFKGLKRIQRAVEEIYNNGMTEIELQVYGSLVREELSFCRYFDPFSEAERDEVFARMDMLAVPSSCTETFGMVVLEALSYGVPVMVTDTVGAKRILEQSSLEMGVILPDTHEAWRKCIEDVYLNRGKVRYYSENICREPLELEYMEHVERVVGVYGYLRVSSRDIE